MPINLFDESVKKYLKTDNTNFAIMITGEWGIGKTYYLKQLISRLTAQNRKALYVSLFGVQGNNDVTKKIFVALYPILNKKPTSLLSKVIKVASSFTPLNADEVATMAMSEFINIGNETILIFDDLERLETVHRVGVLGYINDLVEHKNAKVIIVANENELLPDSQSKEDYLKYVEKVVRYKLRLELDFPSVANEICNTHKVRKDLIPKVLLAFNIGNYFNLRTLNFVAASVPMIIDKLELLKTREDIDGFLEESCIYFLAAVSIENRRGALNLNEIRKWAEFSMERPKDLSKLFPSDANNSLFDTERNEKNSNENKIEDAYKIYFRRDELYYFESIVKYVEMGYLNEPEFDSEIDQAAKYLLSQLGSAEQKALYRLSQWFTLEDDQVLQTIDQVLYYAKNGLYSLENYINIYYYIYHLVKQDVISYDLTKVAVLLEEGVANLKERKYIRDLDVMTRNDPNEPAYVVGLRNKIFSKNAEIERESHADVSEMHLDLLFSDPKEYLKKFIYRREHNIPCLNYGISPQDFLRNFSQLSNANKQQVIGIIEERQKRVLIDSNEAKWMNNVLLCLKEDITISKNAVSTFNKKKLAEAFERLVEFAKQFIKAKR